MTTPQNNDDAWQESSTNFDRENVRPFLQRISSLIDSGFGEAQIDAEMETFFEELGKNTTMLQ
jgi:hypothetical protein